MRKYLLITIISLLPLSVFSQGNFGALGTTWHYSFGQFLSPISSPVIFQSIDTATVGGVLCNHIVMTGQSCAPVTDFYVYESNDSVYWYLPTLNTFSVLYDFNAQPGDTLTITCDGWGSVMDFNMAVDSVGSIVINGTNRALFYWHWTYEWNGDYPLEFLGSVVEGIGDINFLVPQVAVCDPQAYGMRCYEDSLVGLYFTGITPSCDTTINLSVPEVFTPGLSVSPNPVKDILTINLPQQVIISFVEMYDMMGRKIMSYDLTCAHDLSINVSHISKGIYTLKLKTNSTDNVTKFVKI